MIEIFKEIEDKFNFEIITHRSLSGGSISRVYRLETTQGNLILKLNKEDKLNMFSCEKVGLETLEATNTIRIPKVWGVNSSLKYSYILMEYIPTGQANQKTHQDFGEKLAQLHTHQSNQFGFETDNWIGSLPQNNHQHSNWSHFYWHQRIRPQYELALNQSLVTEQDIPLEEDFLKVIEQEFCTIKPSLIHGDLWSGNYLIDKQANATLIDPSVHYGHPMMDIGMSKLFGGFAEEFYTAYKSNSSCKENWENQIELAQWYYLLVHLNLFGKSYLSSVQRIKTKYFND